MINKSKVQYKRKIDKIMASLRNSIVFFDHPMKPVGEKDWEVLSSKQSYNTRDK